MMQKQDGKKGSRRAQNPDEKRKNPRKTFSGKAPQIEKDKGRGHPKKRSLTLGEVHKLKEELREWEIRGVEILRTQRRILSGLGGQTVFTEPRRT